MLAGPAGCLVSLCRLDMLAKTTRYAAWLCLMECYDVYVVLLALQSGYADYDCWQCCAVCWLFCLAMLSGNAGYVAG
jgi:hypothetical protein